MRHVSCASATIYREGAWPDDPERPDQSATGGTRPDPEPCAEIYPPYRYDRPPPRLFGGDERKRAAAAEAAHAVALAFPRGPGVALVRLSDACVSRTVAYVMAGDETWVLYETHRPVDREAATIRIAHGLRLVDDYRRADPFVAHLWVGSAAGTGYGHWLVDDLPRLRALVALRQLRPYAKIQVLTPDGDAAQNLMRAQSCGAICHSLGMENVELVFVDREAKVFFEELYYVSPVTHHPGLKSPDAMRFVAAHGAPDPEGAAKETPKRLFITRGRSGRCDLVNQEEVAALLETRGFTAVDPRPMAFPMQARLFRDAECVIGDMTMSMANTVFCREGTRIGYLAPEGWIEPFFWDLAAARKQRHATCFGHVAPGPGPAWQKHYRVNPRDLEAMLAELDPAPQQPRSDPLRIWS